jgi:quercetin dioxygenase-like cupin family protein
MTYRIPLVAAAIAVLALPGMASAKSTRLDIDQLRYDVVHDGVRRTVLAVDSEGRPLSVLLRIGKGQVLPPHGESGGVRLLTVISGTLSWGDGDKVDTAVERSFGPGSVIIIPAQGGVHWAAARRDDVLIQVVVVGGGALSPDVSGQVAP